MRDYYARSDVRGSDYANTVAAAWQADTVVP
jgi:hypothetical protein